MLPPELEGWQPRGDVALCHQQRDNWQYVAVANHILFNIPSDNPKLWHKLDDGWEASYVRNAGDVVPSRDLTRLNCWANVLTVEDNLGEQWLAPNVLTPTGARAYSVAYAGADFLPSPTDEQARADAIAKEARQAMTAEEGAPIQAACRWAAVLLSITSHVTPATIAALGVLDTALVQKVLIVATGADARLDATDG